MSKPKYFLPEHVRELAPPQAAQLEQLRRRLLDCYTSYGYRFVSPPILEYADALASGAATDLQRHMVTIAEGDDRPLALRVDFTPQVARLDSICSPNHSAQRYCYAGTIVLRHPRTPMGARNPMQLGAELFGCDSDAADCEVFTMLLESLGQLGLQGQVLRLGDTRVVHTLCKLAGFTAKASRACLQHLARRNLNGFEPWLKQHCNQPQLVQAFTRLPRMFGGLDMCRSPAWQQLAQLDPALGRLLDKLAELGKQLGGLNSAHNIVIDLANMRGYAYHNGQTMALYCGDSLVAQGGRYDGIGHFFGRSRAATGFSIDMDLLRLALPASPPDACTWVAYNLRDAAHKWIAAARHKGEQVICALLANQPPPDYCTHQLVAAGDDWQRQPMQQQPMQQKQHKESS